MRSLTPRLRQILQLAAGGASNSEIASALGITRHTVKIQLTNIAKRYELHGRTALVVEGIRRGDVDELQAYADAEARRRCEV